MAVKICPNCGACIAEENKYCDYCGSYQVKEQPKKKPEINHADYTDQGNTVNIEFPVIPGKLLINCARIEAFVKNVKVFEGGYKLATATFELSEPSNVLIKISRWPDKKFQYPIEPGKNYELVLRVADSGYGFDVDFKQKIHKIKI